MTSSSIASALSRNVSRRFAVSRIARPATPRPAWQRFGPAGTALVTPSPSATLQSIDDGLLRRSFSSTADSSGSTGGIRGWMEDRKKRKEHEKYMEQMERLASLETFKLTDFKEELDRSLKSSIVAKISFLQSNEMKIAKSISASVDSMVKILGKDAVPDDLLSLTRLQRLQIADESDRTVEEVGFVVSQIQNMDIMQKVLRRRKLAGKPIPENAIQMQEAIKKDGRNVMSTQQREVTMKKHKELAKRINRRR